MKILFSLGALVGFAGTIAGAHFYPWVDPPRLPSQTSVVANGGRAEQFLIRLPADRIGAQGSADAGLRATPFPAGVELPASLLTAPLMTEQFKVRDRSGSVIGVAARHWTVVEGESSTAWLLVIPSRGALLLAAEGEPRAAVDSILGAAGYRTGEAWSGAASLVASGGSTGSGQVLTGTDEFAGLDGRYTETWKLAGVRASGELQGTIELDTVTYQSARTDPRAVIGSRR